MSQDFTQIGADRIEGDDPLLSLEPDLVIEATIASPAVRGSWREGLLSIEGESYPENTYEIYDRILSWVDTFLKASVAPLTVVLQLNYLNTSSVRAMIDLFDRLQMAVDQGGQTHVQWIYDSRNPRSAEVGEEFREDYTFPFEVCALDS